MKIKILIFFLLLCNISYSQYEKYNQVKLKTYNNLLFVKITFNDIPCLLLVDTGASKSLLDVNKAEEYGFNYIVIVDTTKKYIGLGGVTEIYIVFGYKVAEYHITFLGTDLYYINEYLKKDHIGIIGIMGGDFLNSHDAYIDYKKKILYYK